MAPFSGATVIRTVRGRHLLRQIIDQANGNPPCDQGRYECRPSADGHWASIIVARCAMVAVIAARTRMHSKPSRKTSTPMSSAAALRPRCGARGSGLPAWLNACQIKTAATVRPATDKAIRFVPTSQHYNLNWISDATHLHLADAVAGANRRAVSVADPGSPPAMRGVRWRLLRS